MSTRTVPDGAQVGEPPVGALPDWRFCVAPMLDWTDRHCRYFHRRLTRRARLYTEMITTGAILHGDAARLLAFNPAEQPVALQLGGSEPDELARAARQGAQYGYAEINLNCGCPSERVQRGAFGACLMREPSLVADGFKAMADVVSIPVTIKHRIGLGRDERYDPVRDFVGAIFDAGCRVFIVHARNAWLEGLSPKENREIPPLRYDMVRQLKRDFPDARIVLNGGVQSLAEAAVHAREFDGVMVGRAAYHDPWLLAQVDAQMFGEAPVSLTREEVVQDMAVYAARMRQEGVPLRAIVRHMLGLYHGCTGARGWRRTLSDARQLAAADEQLLLAATAALLRGPRREQVD